MTLFFKQNINYIYIHTFPSFFLSFFYKWAIGLGNSLVLLNQNLHQKLQLEKLQKNDTNIHKHTIPSLQVLSNNINGEAITQAQTHDTQNRILGFTNISTNDKNGFCITKLFRSQSIIYSSTKFPRFPLKTMLKNLSN